MKPTTLWAIILGVTFIYLAQTPLQKESITITSSDEASFANLVDADVVFTGYDIYSQSTSTSTDSVRIFKDGTDLGAKSLNSGTLSVVPNSDYRLLFFMNATLPSHLYYVDVQDYTAKVQESADNLIGEGCAIDTSPGVSVKTSAGLVQSSSANAQAMSSGQTKTFEVRIKASSDKCYGMPDAEKGNAICFDYDSTIFSNIKTNTQFISVPPSISTLDLGTVKCFEFPKLKNAEWVELTVELTSSAEPTTTHNVSIFTDDIAFDLNARTLEEIWGFADEDNNQLGRTITSTPDAKIYVS